MSDDSENQAFANFFGACCTNAATALLVYDFTITFDNEVTLFWMEHPLSGAFFLFLTNRYLTLVAQIINVLPVLSSAEVAALPANTSSAISILEIPLTSILTSRFLISLQKFQRKTMGSSTDVSLGEVVFQPQTSSRFIGSLGAQLSVYEDDDGENDSETGDGDVS
ncbi:hypothetical protein BD311DRAFT_661376 [Dichomitus squalens]|uniref:DUF6533 domain-containing protein n=1 Tax=Dichomitus squalens TaxID=114155 RepID=A0A4Q9PJR7_9APHY|nr:hypothetical protein BD311DRAFT_661376 [Dichomitus squalens]TBU54359.1 hypothetical protein BD310DRAFT_828119 [Dichomitus squalens]